MLTVSQARARIQAALSRCSTELVRIDDALGRSLARDVIAARELPPWHSSAMDGFAVRAGDTPGSLRVAGTLAAGAAPGAALDAGTAWRIMTGAPLPGGADAVVIREDASDHGDTVDIAGSARAGQNIRRAGEDVAGGARALAAGVRLGPGEIGLLAALGHAAIAVARRPRVALVSTGDELVSAGVAPRPGQIVNSNAYALAAQIREAGGVPVHMGIAPDLRAIQVNMMRAGLEADVLLTTGGVSVGDYDLVKDAFAEIGVEVSFWKVAMKPGKPLVFGVTAAGVPVFGLPGNPVSAMVVFELFVRPALLTMQGLTDVDRPRVEVILGEPYRKSAGRAHYLRARLARHGDALRATPLSRQGSGMLSSMVCVDALVEIAAEASDTPAGARVPALLLRAL